MCACEPKTEKVNKYRCEEGGCAHKELGADKQRVGDGTGNVDMDVARKEDALRLPCEVGHVALAAASRVHGKKHVMWRQRSIPAWLAEPDITTCHAETPNCKTGNERKSE